MSLPTIRTLSLLRKVRRSLAAMAALGLAASAQAQEKFTYMTNWYAQAEHGGFYQAVATGIYKKYGLDVTIRMGGPQVNILQLHISNHWIKSLNACKIITCRTMQIIFWL